MRACGGGPLVVVEGAELDEFDGFLDDGDVAGGEVIDVAGGDDLVVVGVTDPEPTTDQVAPVGARAAPVREAAGEEAGGVSDGDALDGER